MLAKIKEQNVEPLSLTREEMATLVRRDAAVFSRVAKGSKHYARLIKTTR